jgi:hypothetical protein
MMEESREAIAIAGRSKVYAGDYPIASRALK